MIELKMSLNAVIIETDEPEDARAGCDIRFEHLAWDWTKSIHC
jgi:hypothetical protein